MEIFLFGLLHVVANKSNATNMRTRNPQQHRLNYLKIAAVLSKSLKQCGIPFTLLTNQKEIICDDLQQLGYQKDLIVETIEFTTEVPAYLPFYSAHFKFDCYRYLASLSKPYVGLVDLDVIALGPLPQCLKNIAEAGIPLCYDISDQVLPAYGHDVILRDMKTMLPTVCEGRWLGGELLMGSPEFFATLSTEIAGLYDSYIAHATHLHHQGDEVLVSVALEKLRSEGLYIADAGTLGIIGRYWNNTTKHPQKPFEYFENSFLLHLPGDKDFLASLFTNPTVDREEILRLYRRHLRKSMPRIALKKIVQKVWPNKV